MTGLLEFAERCEQATGPDRELELDIQEALGFEVRRAPDYIFKATRACGMYLDKRDGEPDRWIEAPRLTASLDAAMTLVPEGWYWQVGQGNHAWAAAYENPIPPSTRVDPIAATPALALCAAALRARAAQGEPS